MLEKTLNQWVTEKDEEIEDPFVSQGGVLKYQNQHSFIIRIQEKPDLVQTLKDTQLITVKIVVQSEHETPKNVRIELTSDTQIYFNFLFECNDWQFKRIKANQNFFIEFREYPDVILKNFERLLQSEKYVALFTIFSETEGRLSIIRKTEFKDQSIIEFDFVRAPEEQIKLSIQYRYDVMRRNYENGYLKYQAVSSVIRAKNPSLMIQINKMLKKKQ